MGLIYIYLYLVDFYGKLVGKYTSPMDPMGGSGPRPAVSPRISKCRMEAVALDGLELLMEPLAKANPTAKVRSEGRWAIGDFGGFFCYFIYLVDFRWFLMILDVWIYQFFRDETDYDLIFDCQIVYTWFWCILAVNGENCWNTLGMRFLGCSKRKVLWSKSWKSGRSNYSEWKSPTISPRCLKFEELTGELFICVVPTTTFVFCLKRIGDSQHGPVGPGDHVELADLSTMAKILGCVHHQTHCNSKWHDDDMIPPEDMSRWRASNDPRCQVERRRSPLTFCHGQENLGWNDLTILTALVHNGNLILLVTFDSCVLDSLPVAPAYSSTTLHVRRHCTIITSTTVVVVVMVIMLIPLLLYLM